MSEIQLTNMEFKALSSQTRTGIMKALLERNHTLSELSTKMGMSAPTIKEHMNVLLEAGIIELRDEGRKWKYYSLTRKGRDILEAKQRQANILIILSCTAILLGGLLFMLQFSAIGQNQYSATHVAPTVQPAAQTPRNYSAPAEPGNARPAPAGQAATAMRADVNGTLRCTPAFPVDTPEARGYAQYCYTASTRDDCLAVPGYGNAAQGTGACRWSDLNASG